MLLFISWLDPDANVGPTCTLYSTRYMYFVHNQQLPSCRHGRERWSWETVENPGAQVTWPVEKTGNTTKRNPARDIIISGEMAPSLVNDKLGEGGKREKPNSVGTKKKEFFHRLVLLLNQQCCFWIIVLQILVYHRGGGEVEGNLPQIETGRMDGYGKAPARWRSRSENISGKTTDVAISVKRKVKRTFSTIWSKFLK